MPKKPGNNKTYGFNYQDAGALVKLIGTDAGSFRENVPRGAGGSGAAKLFYTPSTGMNPAYQTNGTVYAPSALCTEYEWQTTGTFAAISTGNTSQVYNITDVSIAGNVLIVANRVQGYWVVVVAMCGTGGSGSFQTWTQ